MPKKILILQNFWNLGAIFILPPAHTTRLQTTVKSQQKWFNFTHRQLTATHFQATTLGLRSTDST